MVRDEKTGLYLPEMTEAERREMHEMEENGELPTKIDRSMDLFFRFLLGVPTRVELLLDLINSLFSVLGYPRVEKAELIHTELPPGGAGLKHSRLDLRAWDVMGRLLSIELQRENHMYFIPRCLYYLSKMFLERLREGERYGELCPVLMIVLLGFNMFDDATRGLWDFVWMNPAKRTLLMPDQTMQALFFVELEKIRKNIKTLHQRAKQPGYVLTDEERLWVWGGYMCNDKAGVELVRTTLTGDAVFHKVREAEAEYWNSPEYRYWQTRAQMERMDQQAYREDAWNRGMAEGISRGISQGISQGIAQNQIETARQLLSMGLLSVEQIAQATQLPVGQVEMLRRL